MKAEKNNLIEKLELPVELPQEVKQKDNENRNKSRILKKREG